LIICPLDQYNWAELGAQAGKIAGRCLSDDDLTMGGAFLYEKYLKYKFEGVSQAMLILLQLH
jgi:hypothetical protein